MASGLYWRDPGPGRCHGGRDPACTRLGGRVVHDLPTGDGLVSEPCETRRICPC